MWWMCCRERPEPTAARALTADQWANQAGMGGAMGTPRQAVATGAYPVKDGRREGETVASGAGQEGQDRGQPKACFKACEGSVGMWWVAPRTRNFKLSFSQIEARAHYLYVLPIAWARCGGFILCCHIHWRLD